MRRAVATWAGLLSSTVLLTGALAGCTGDEPDDPATTTSGADTETSASPSPTAEPSPDVTKPERPAAMDEHDADGAAAAAVYFMELYPYIMKTGDTAEFEKMSHKSCGYCDEALEQAGQIAERGDKYIGGDITANVVKTYRQDAATGILPLDVEVAEKASSIEDSEGNVLFESEAATSLDRVEIAWSDDGKWVVLGVPDTQE
ncbi:DUF6318 family protein [Isoptericola sp. BMS4]|uniref:DUF6318 family protein n=1 Tax=Isoptericola sp. BMS4 TaxID=2527875 RepID=UPI00141F6311|nr:DUF6318 family protein [Isoptericola sp. BMS4]